MLIFFAKNVSLQGVQKKTEHFELLINFQFTTLISPVQNFNIPMRMSNLNANAFIKENKIMLYKIRTLFWSTHSVPFFLDTLYTAYLKHTRLTHNMLYFTSISSSSAFNVVPVPHFVPCTTLPENRCHWKFYYTSLKRKTIMLIVNGEYISEQFLWQSTENWNLLPHKFYRYIIAHLSKIFLVLHLPDSLSLIVVRGML